MKLIDANHNAITFLLGNLFRQLQYLINIVTSYSLLDIASTLAWGLGYFGMPHILLRFMAIEDEKKLVLSRRIASVWVVIAMTASIVIGMVGLGMTKAGALEFLSGSSSETLIVRVASLIAQHGVLAAILAGLILAGILAATMSTADSQMLAAASSVSQNILQEFGHMKLTEKQSLFAARLTIICISVVGVVLARDPNSSVFGIVSFAWAGFGGSFGAVVLCSLFWKRCNWQGALAGMLRSLQPERWHFRLGSPCRTSQRGPSSPCPCGQKECQNAGRSGTEYYLAS